jgi:hypothetical protein
MWCTVARVKLWLLKSILIFRPSVSYVLWKAFAEVKTKRFNRLYREAILNAYLITDIREVRALTIEWMEGYNQRQPLEALQNQLRSHTTNKSYPYLNTFKLAEKRSTFKTNNIFNDSN